MPDDERPWDKAPRSRRNDDYDDEEDRRRDRRERDGDYDGDYDEEYEDRRLKRAVRREHLLAVAFAQRGIIVCILIYFGLVAAQFAIPPELKFWLAIGLIPLGLLATVFVFMLALRVYGQTAGIVLGLLTLVPVVGLIVLLAVNQRATKILTDADVRVGLLGANTSDIR